MVFQGGIMFEEELKNDIFTDSPIGTTMQDGGKRERKRQLCQLVSHISCIAYKYATIVLYTHFKVIITA